MKAGWFSKGGQSRTQTNSSEDLAEADLGTSGVGYRAPSDNSSMLESASLGGNNIPEENIALRNVQR